MGMKARGEWAGTLKTGRGTMTPAHGPAVPFSLGSRFEGQPASNPEELIGAALAGCFSMALSLGLEQAGATPVAIATDADVTLEKVGEGFAIRQIALTCRADAKGIDADRFAAVAEATKIGSLLNSHPRSQPKSCRSRWPTIPLFDLTRTELLSKSAVINFYEEGVPWSQKTQLYHL